MGKQLHRYALPKTLKTTKTNPSYLWEVALISSCQADLSGVVLLLTKARLREQGERG